MKNTHVSCKSLDTPLQLPAVGYIRLPVVCAVTGLGRSTVWAWVRKRRFPAPIKLSARASAWNVDDLRIWLADPVAWQAENHVDGEDQ